MANVKIREIPKDDEISRILQEEMRDEYQERYVYVDEDNTCMPLNYAKFADAIENFEVENSDVWICSYPKTGTTWSQEMVWLIAKDLDFEGAKEDLLVRFPFLELCTLCNFSKLTGKNPEPLSNTVKLCKEYSKPRFIKCHLPFPIMPRDIRNGTKTPKIIYIMRNPKDTCVSYYHHYRLLLGCRANIEDFTKAFLADKVMYGSYWKHIFGFWEKRSKPNYLFIKYEDMKEDLPSVIKQVATFFGKKLNNEQIEKLTQHLNFASMKNNEAVNLEKLMEIRRKKNVVVGAGSFMRSGKVGKYKEELCSETIQKFEEWIKKNTQDSVFAEYCSKF